MPKKQIVFNLKSVGEILHIPQYDVRSASDGYSNIAAVSVFHLLVKGAA